MPKINTIYIVNHSHTDIGFTDYQDLCFRQHGEFIDQALDLIEQTQDYPEDARYRWVCEVTGTTERYLRGASETQVQRFKHWHDAGYIDIGGMQYNLTPMLNVEQMQRSLYPVRRLRDEYGLTIESAMQCDVDGVSWRFADLLPAIGIDFLTMAVNPIRGGVPKPMPGAFWWDGPAGGRILVWNGLHYLFGRSIARFGDWNHVDASLPPILAQLEADERYPFDFLYCQSTHPMRVDNGPPDPRMPDFVRDWNAQGREPRLAFTTPSAFARLLREQAGDMLEVRTGDWLDWWSDGVASSAYETGVSRRTHEQLLMAETIGSWLAANGDPPWRPERAAHVYEQATLYDEHTWGAFASIDAPSALWTRGQWNHKAGYAYRASAEANDLLARASRGFAETVADLAPDGRFNLGDLAPETAYPHAVADELLIINSLPWERTVIVDEPEHRGGAAPAGVLESFFPREVPWGGLKPETPLRRVTATVPAFGYAVVPMSQTPGNDDLKAAPGVIENACYRIRVDPETGGLAEWHDKTLRHDFASTYRGWRIGQYVYERVDSPEGRNALVVGDFSMEDFGYWRTDTPWQRQTVESVTVEEPVLEQGRVSIGVRITAPGIRGGRCVYSLDSQQRSLAIDWVLDKVHERGIEAVFIAFPFALEVPDFRADLNGVACTPDVDQIEGSVRDWYPVQRWVDVSDGTHGVTFTPLDAPLVQVGGITTGRTPAKTPPEGPTLMSWALHNHWMVNFKATQGGEIPLRYRLTTHEGTCDDAAAARFGDEAATPPVVLRDYAATGARSGQFLNLNGNDDVLLHAKPAENGDGIILRLQNLTEEPTQTPIRFTGPRPASATITSPVERDRDALPLDGASLTVPLSARGLQSVRVRF